MAKHLDTTALVERMFGTEADKERIETEIASGNAVVTSYVHQQYRATFLCAAILLDSLVKQRRSVPLAIRDLDSYAFATKGEGAQARKILTTLMESHDLRVDDILETLKRWIEFEIDDSARDAVATADETGCCYVSGEVERNGEGLYYLRKTCTLRDPRPCRIEGFWNDRMGELGGVTNCAQIKHLASAASAAADYLAAPRKKPPRGDRCTVALSDAVIVAESPPGAEVLTTNLKDFVPLVQAMPGRRSVRKP